MRVALHGRISTEERAEGQKLDSQKFAVSEFAKLHDHQVVASYYEDGWSGDLTQRPQLDKLLEDARNKLFDALITSSPDRLSRNQTHQLMILGELEQLEIKLIFLSNPDYESLSKESKVMTKGLYAMVGELERLKIIERTTRGRLSKAHSGNVVTSKPPYGFSYVRGNKDLKIQGKFIHNPNEIETVKLILNLALDGKSDRQIIKILKEKNIKSRKGKNVWARSTITKILSTNLDTYAGTWNYLKYVSAIPKERIKKDAYIKNKKSSRKLTDKSNWIQVPIPNLAIITKNEAEKIRAIRKANKQTSLGNTKNFYLLQKMVYHKECNTLCYADNFHSKPFYRCADKRRRFLNPDTCKGESIKSETLDNEVWSDIKNLILNPDLILENAKKFIASKKDDVSFSSQGINEIDKKRKELEVENQRLITAYREGILTLDDLKKQKVLIEQKSFILNNQEREIIKKQTTLKTFDVEDFTEDIKSLTSDLKTVIDNLTPEEKKQLLKWFNVKVSFSNFSYVLEGAIPISEDVKSRSQHFTKGSRILLKENEIKFSIPFTLTGKLPKYINQNKIVWV